jgi:hypothetical protein
MDKIGEKLIPGPNLDELSFVEVQSPPVPFAWTEVSRLNLVAA